MIKYEHEEMIERIGDYDVDTADANVEAALYSLISAKRALMESNLYWCDETMETIVSALDSVIDKTHGFIFGN